MSYIILARNPRNDQVVAITDTEADRIIVYPTRDAAEADAVNVPVCRAWPWTIVEAP